MAIAVFELAAEYYPDDANTYDFLAEAYLELAMKNYEKAVALDPTNWGAHEISSAIRSATN